MDSIFYSNEVKREKGISSFQTYRLIEENSQLQSPSSTAFPPGAPDFTELVNESLIINLTKTYF